MKRRNRSYFVTGLTFGVLVGAIIWYWQKSTSAEDGALALMDRLAMAEKKLRQLSLEISRSRSEPRVALESAPAAPDDLQKIRGVGPVFDERLRQSGIVSYEQLAEVRVDDLARILQVGEARAESILRELRAVFR